MGRWRLPDPASLGAVQQRPGASRSNVLSYKFTVDGEQRLTRWMMDHLDVGFVVVPDGSETAEKA
ncbi:MAG: hypothetical protein GY911_03055, partial [Actinomycetales bacterium]|nr:hypothetical protein [Actinomycetales bacterium]